MENNVNNREHNTVLADNEGFFGEVEEITMVVSKKSIDRLYEICEILASERDTAILENLELIDNKILLENKLVPTVLDLSKFDDVVKEIEEVTNVADITEYDEVS